jgi:hypothetical protein
MPLAIDLFCGLSQSQFFSRANSTIKQLVAGRTQNPDHVPLSVSNHFPCTISLVLWLMRNLKNAALSARFAGIREVRIFPSKAPKNGILEWPSQIIYFLDMRFASMKCTSLFARCLACAVGRAIPLIRIGRHDVEMRFATETVATRLCDIGLFAASASARASLTCGRTVPLVWPHRLEFSSAIHAEQIVHAP